MAETLSLSQHPHAHHAPPQLDSTSFQSCEVCSRWERQFALQASELANVQKQLVDRDQYLSRLEQDMQQLNTKYVSAIDHVADIQHEKDLVEHDLEELSCKLFEEANEMVAFEKREKWLLETQLQSVKQQLMDEQAQLAELRQRLLEWDNDEQKRRQQQKNKKSYKGSLSRRQQPLITTTLKEEDEDEQSNNDHRKQYDNNNDGDGGDDDDENDNYDNEDEDEDDDHDENDDSDDETWQDTLEDQKNMDDPQLRAQHDLALLHGVQKNQHANITLLDHKTTTSLDDKKKKQQVRSVSMPPPPPSATVRPTISPTIDQVQLEAFQQFVHAASTVPLKKLYQFAYMKYCQLEDVEPCLRFGPHSRLSVKKMMDYLLQQPCFIQQMSHDNATHNTNTYPQQTMTTVIPSSVAQRPLLWDRWHSNKSNDTSTPKKVHSTTTTTVTPIGCAACGRSRQTNKDGQDLTTYYQFKMDEKDDWLPMDQYCRDRLVAVCEFFVFIRNIHLRLYVHRAIDDLYSENIRLRLQMFYSRMGALPVILGGIGLNADAIGKACPPLDQDYVSDGSTSSHYCPTTPK